MKLDYLKIRTENGEIYGGNQSMFSKNIKRSGCGMIASCDTVLFVKGKKSVDESEYRRIIENSGFYRRRLRPFGIPTGFICRYLASCLDGRKFLFIPARRLSRESMEKHFTDSIGAGIPVIVRVGFNGKKFRCRITNPVNGRQSESKISWHYITVTGCENGSVFFSTWGKQGEAELSELHRHLGVLGGIIVSENIQNKNGQGN